jgi:hypothetical protein
VNSNSRGSVLESVFASVHPTRGNLDGFDDIQITRASAQIAINASPDLFFGWIWVSIKQEKAGEQHTWRAVTALQGLLF